MKNTFDLYDVQKVHYWKADFRLKITMIAQGNRDHLIYLLKDVKHAKDKSIELFGKII